MKKTLLLLSTVLSTCAYSQVTLFQDNFESGSGNWTLNTGGSGQNQWMVNNEYLGYSGLIDDTPDQPGTFTGGTQSTYMHITNNTVCGSFGVCNANFDTGSSSNRSASITTPLNTTGFTNVNLQFYYLCAGETGTAYGIVEYSTDGGSTWGAASGQYSNVTTWTQVNITNAAFNNQASLKFRFRWQNGGSGSDPAFSVDEVLITGEQGNFASVATGSIANTSYCSNTSANITVPFTVTGTVNSGNQYIAQLSNSTGSFASPTVIGSLNSTSNGSLSINATIPSGLTAGTNYLIRVIATDPATTGTNSSTTLTINAAPSASVIALPANGIICQGESITLQGNGGASYSWSPSNTVDNATAQTVSATPLVTTMYTVTVTGQNGCASTATFTVTVDDCAALKELSETDIIIYPNPAKNFINFSIANSEKANQVSIFDLNGKIVLSGLNSEKIDISSLTEGEYLILLKFNEKQVTVPFTKH